VLLQGYADLEYFVIDGGSTDHSVNIIRKYEPWLASWVSEPDRGQSHAINKGLFRATGEYFNYINSDDVLAPGALAAVAEGFAAHSSADFIHGKCVIGDASGRATSVRQGSGRDFADMFVNLLAGNGLHPLTVFYRREAVVRVGGFREHLEQEMDADLWFRLLDAGCQIGTIGACLGTFRCHPNQKSVSPRRIDELLTVMLEAIERHRGFSDRERHELSRRASQRCARQKLWAASSSFQSGRYRDYGRCCARAVQMDPLVMGSWVFWTNVSAPIKPLIPKSLADFARRHARHPTSSAAG
jgi:glycosyltransferase involved in cell wall biosynthesis